MRPFEPAIRRFDRAEAGFPALPTNGSVKIETIDRQNWNREYSPPHYDVMLHFVEDPPGFRYSYCTVAFRKSADGLRWIGEQDSFHGPLQYEADGVMVHETVTITRETEQMAFVGTNISGTVITYQGPDPRLKSGLFAGLGPADIGPMLREWGYDYQVDKAQPDGATNGSQPFSSETNSTPSAAGSRR
ncbi:MAG TPA: hypothetical protein VN673_04515 [Clostridia bacterium]|nr:hypothetical protein [Clostridia bacterium]